MDFAQRISVTCFAASYAIGMGNEILRIFWPKRIVRWLATGAALAGIVAQTLYLMAIAFTQGRLPIATQFESLITVSWLISLVYLYLLLRDGRMAAGIFILPVSLSLVLFAATLSDRGYRDLKGGLTVVGPAHGVLLLAGTVLVVFALLTALMYLVKVRQLKAGNLLATLKLPSLERLDHLHTVFVYLAYALLSIGIVLGIGMQFTNVALRWTDPKLLTTLSAWGLFTMLVHYRHRPENRGRKVAVMTIVACLLVLLSVLGDPIFGTGHQTVPEVRG